jgi:hypothetical protein
MAAAKHTPIIERPLNSGTQKVYQFPNGYGASVVCGPYTYGGRTGLFELAVLRFKSADKWGIVYDTPITNDVLGFLSDTAVDDVLDEIAALAVAKEST